MAWVGKTPPHSAVRSAVPGGVDGSEGAVGPADFHDAVRGGQPGPGVGALICVARASGLVPTIAGAPATEPRLHGVVLSALPLNLEMSPNAFKTGSPDGRGHSGRRDGAA